MREHHLLLLSGLIFSLSAVISAFSNTALMAAFIALAGMCTTLGILGIARRRERDREEERDPTARKETK